MVRPPTYIDKVNAVVKFWQNPCDAKLIVYAETALVPAGGLLLLFLSAGMDDVIRGYARPKGISKRWKRRRGKKGKLRFFGIPDLGNWVGTQLAGAEIAKGRHISQGVKNLWIVDGVLQRGLWYWLIIDGLSDFLYEWSTALNKTEFCQDAGRQRMVALGTGGGLIAILDWQALLCPFVESITPPLTWNVSTGSLDVGIYDVTTAVFFKNTGFLPQKVQCGIFEDPLFNKPLALSEKVQVDPGFEGQCVTSVVVAGPGQYTVGWRNDFGGTTGLWSGTFVMQTGL